MNRKLKPTCIFTVIILLTAVMVLAAFSSTAGTYASTKTDNNTGNAANKITGLEDRLKGAIILYIGSPKAYVNGHETRIDVKDPEVAPVIKNNVKMVPLRFIAESYGTKVYWDSKNRTASITIGKKAYKFKQGSNILTAGNTKYKLDVPVQTIKGRLFIPLGKFVEILGKKAFYDRGLIIISDQQSTINRVSDKAVISQIVSRLSYLPVVGSYEKLKEILKNAQQSGANINGYANDVAVSGLMTAEEAGSQTTGAQKSESAADSASQDFSGTNVQVQGVDEGDIVKTDGQYIYQVNRQRVVVARAYPPNDMKVLNIINYSNMNFTPSELYLNNNKLIVIGTSQANIPIYKEKDDTRTEIYPAL